MLSTFNQSPAIWDDIEQIWCGRDCLRPHWSATGNHRWNTRAGKWVGVGCQDTPDFSREMAHLMDVLSLQDDVYQAFLSAINNRSGSRLRSVLFLGEVTHYDPDCGVLVSWLLTLNEAGKVQPSPPGKWELVRGWMQNNAEINHAKH